MPERGPDEAELAAAISRGRPLEIAPAERAQEITWTREPPPEEWLIDGEQERPIDEHREAHAAGRPSEATLRYGAGTDAELVARRLLELAELSADTGLLRAVCPIPGEGGESRPGSWGVEDLSIIALCRSTLPAVDWIRPSWHYLGPAACQVAVSFGANDWVIPADDDTDPGHLAQAIGCRAVAR